MLCGYVLQRKGWSLNTVDDVVESAFDAFLDWFNRNKFKIEKDKSFEDFRKYFFGVLRGEISRKSVLMYEDWLSTTGGEGAVLAYRREKERKRWTRRIAKIRSDPQKLAAYKEKRRAQGIALRARKSVNNGAVLVS